jgi:zinc transport system permease protein
MFEALSNLDYKVWTFVVGIAIAACCSLLSTYVVLRRMALIAEGVAHAGFGGFGVAFILGYFFSFSIDSVWAKLIMSVFCVVTALGIRFITRGRKVHDDSAIGIFLVASIALGLVLIKIGMVLYQDKARNLVSAENLLFGDFLASDFMSGMLSAGTAIACIAVIALLYYQFLYTTLDEEMARVNGVPTGLVNFLLLLLISLVVVVGSRMVGALMITALMIIPGATGSMLSRRFGGVLLASLITGVGGTILALTLSFNTKLNIFPPGAILVLTLFVIFSIVWLARHLFKPKVAHAPAEAFGDSSADSHAESHAGHVH